MRPVRVVPLELPTVPYGVVAGPVGRQEGMAVARRVAPEERFYAPLEVEGQVVLDDAVNPEVAHGTSFLVPLGAIAAVTGAAVIPAVGGGLSGFDPAVGVQISAAAAEAGFLVANVYAAGPTAVVGYLALTFIVIEILESLNGCGAPDLGKVFQDGSATFSNSINSILESAYPTSDEWAGSAADRYAADNQEQQNFVQQAADADKKIADGLRKQAYWVQAARETMASSRLGIAGGMVLIGSLTAAWSYWGQMPPTGTAIAAAIANIAHSIGNSIAFWALLADFVFLIGLFVSGSNTENICGKVVDSYRGIIDNIDAMISTGPAIVGMPAASVLATPCFSDVFSGIGGQLSNLTGKANGAGVAGRMPAVTPPALNGLNGLSEWVQPSKPAAAFGRRSQHFSLANRVQRQVLDEVPPFVEGDAALADGRPSTGIAAAQADYSEDLELESDTGQPRGGRPGRRG